MNEICGETGPAVYGENTGICEREADHPVRLGVRTPGEVDDTSLLHAAALSDGSVLMWSEEDAESRREIRVVSPGPLGPLRTLEPGPQRAANAAGRWLRSRARPGEWHLFGIHVRDDGSATARSHDMHSGEVVEKTFTSSGESVFDSVSRIVAGLWDEPGQVGETLRSADSGADTGITDDTSPKGSHHGA